MIRESWRAFAETLPVIAFSMLPDGSLEHVNRRWFEFSGADEAELAKAWAEVVHPDDAARVAEEWQSCNTAGTPFRSEFRIRRHDGTYHWMSVMADPLRDEGGTIVRWVGIDIDVDERVHAREALSERERIFTAIAEAIPQILWTADATGWIEWYNHGWYDYTGQTPEEASGWGWQAVHHPDDFPEVMRRWPDSIASGIPFEMEFRLRGRDGVFRWFLTRAHPVRDESGAIVRWYGTNTDIDAQKSALRRSERVAETLQNVFLPTALPELPGLRFDADYVAAERDALVGGDWFDAFAIDERRVVISIGDVAGHGLSASVSAGRLRQAIAVAAFDCDNPAQVLEKVNRVLRAQEETIATALVAFLDPVTCEVQYATAGHPPPAIGCAGNAAALRAFGGVPLGVAPELRLSVERLTLLPGGALVFFTDGLIEFARDLETAQDKLMATIDELVQRPGMPHPAAAVRRTVLGESAPLDDIALLLVQRTDAPVEPDMSELGLLKRWRFHSSDAYTARTSRQELTRFLQEVAPQADVFASELILGEILANTVEHAPGMVEMSIDWTAQHPVVLVRDTGPGSIELEASLPDDIMSEDGRGLFLIRSLAREVHVSRSRGFGTELRVVLPLER